MNSSSMPRAVAIVFTLGVAVGFGWKLGLIPVHYGPTPAGRLEETEQAGADEPAESPLDVPPLELSPAVIVAQDEPPVEEGINHRELAWDEPSVVDREMEQTPPFVRSAKSRTIGGVDQTASFLRSQSPERIQPTSYAVEDTVTGEEEPLEESSEPVAPADEPPAELTPEPDDRFAEIDEKITAGEFLAAHKLLSKMYWNSKVPDAELQERLDSTAKKIFFSPQPHFIEPYVVQPGDQLAKIARKYNLSWEYLSTLNKVDPRRIRDGQKLKVLKGPFAAIVNLHDYSLTIHLQGYYVKRYDVGIGKDGTSPIGKFPVLDKIENPQYTDPDGKVIEGNDPENPLGKRWIDLGDSYGIHGTIDPDSIGRAESRGCIRLRDADIIEVYNFLVKGSTVEIRE